MRALPRTVHISSACHSERPVPGARNLLVLCLNEDPSIVAAPAALRKRTSPAGTTDNSPAFQRRIRALPRILFAAAGELTGSDEASPSANPSSAGAAEDSPRRKSWVEPEKKTIPLCRRPLPESAARRQLGPPPTSMSSALKPVSASPNPRPLRTTTQIPGTKIETKGQKLDYCVKTVRSLPSLRLP